LADGGELREGRGLVVSKKLTGNGGFVEEGLKGSKTIRVQ